MFLRCVKAEFAKLKHAKVWFLVFVLPVLGVFLGAGNFYMNQGVLQKEWYSLWTQVSLFYAAFFYPAAVAVFCAYACRLEHMNKNWNRVMTLPISVSAVFGAKLAAVGLLSAAAQLVLVLLYFFCGVLFRFAMPMPGELWGWIGRGFLGAVSVATIQLVLSMRLKSFATPVGICLFLCIAGFGVLLKFSGLYFPYSFIAQGMCAVSQEGLSIIDNAIFLAMNLVTITAAYGCGVWCLSKKDVQA